MKKLVSLLLVLLLTLTSVAALAEIAGGEDGIRGSLATGFVEGPQINVEFVSDDISEDSESFIWYVPAAISISLTDFRSIGEITVGGFSIKQLFMLDTHVLTIKADSVMKVYDITDTEIGDIAVSVEDGVINEGTGEHNFSIRFEDAGFLMARRMSYVLKTDAYHGTFTLFAEISDAEIIE